MIYVTQIHGIDQALSFAGWTLALIGAIAAFGGGPGPMLIRWLKRRDGGAAIELARVRSELRTGFKRPPAGPGEEAGERVRGLRSGRGPFEKLSDEERRERAAIEKILARRTLPGRLALYLLGCGLCQAFWLALGLGALLGTREPLGLVCSAFAYAAAAALVLNRTRRGPPEPPLARYAAGGGERSGGGCPTCGH